MNRGKFSMAAKNPNTSWIGARTVTVLWKSTACIPAPIPSTRRSGRSATSRARSAAPALTRPAPARPRRTSPHATSAPPSTPTAMRPSGDQCSVACSPLCRSPCKAGMASSRVWTASWLSTALTPGTRSTVESRILHFVGEDEAAQRHEAVLGADLHHVRVGDGAAHAGADALDEDLVRHRLVAEERARLGHDAVRSVAENRACPCRRGPSCGAGCARSDPARSTGAARRGRGRGNTSRRHRSRSRLRAGAARLACACARRAAAPCPCRRPSLPPVAELGARTPRSAVSLQRVFRRVSGRARRRRRRARRSPGRGRWASAA